MKILFTAAECAPFFKTGGLGDVAGALPKSMAKKGNEVKVSIDRSLIKDHTLTVLFTQKCQKIISHS